MHFNPAMVSLMAFANLFKILSAQCEKKDDLCMALNSSNEFVLTLQQSKCLVHSFPEEFLCSRAHNHQYCAIQ